MDSGEAISSDQKKGDLFRNLLPQDKPQFQVPGQPGHNGSGVSVAPIILPPDSLSFVCKSYHPTSSGLWGEAYLSVLHRPSLPEVAQDQLSALPIIV